MTSRLTLPLYLIASGTSLFGNSAIAIVLPWLVLSRTGDPALTGLVAAASAAPSAIAAFVGGHLVDRIGRRTVCVIADIGSALSVAALAVVDLTMGLTVGWFIVLGILGALFDVPGMTAREAMLADVSATSGVSLDKIAAWRGALFGLSFLAGPALAGWLLAILPAIQVVWLTAACSGLAALTMLAMPLRARARSDADDTSPLAGWTLVRTSRMLRSLMVISLATMVLVAPLLSVILPSHFRILGRPELLGLSLSAYAAGSLVGSGIYGALFGPGRRWPAWVSANVLFVVGFLAIATLTGFWPVAVGMLLLGIGSGLQQPIAVVVLTKAVPEALRGRVFGLYSALGMLAAPIGLGLSAGLIATTNLAITAWILAGCWTAVSIAAVVVRSLRDYLRTPDEEAADADHQPAR